MHLLPHFGHSVEELTGLPSTNPPIKGHLEEVSGFPFDLFDDFFLAFAIHLILLMFDEHHARLGDRR